MSFLRKNTQIFYKILNNKKSSSLPIHPRRYPLAAAMEFQGTLERAALCTFRTGRGSLTVETAVVLPIFLFLCICMVFFIEVFSLHGEIQGGLYRAAREISEKMELYQNVGGEEWIGEEVQNILCTTAAKQKVFAYAGTELDGNSCLSGGRGGLQFSCRAVGEDMVDILVAYQVKLPYAFGLDAAFPVVQRCRIRAWTGISGADQAENSQEMVYITENGTVYHKSTDCTHIKLSIRSIGAHEIAGVRNNGGGRYKACEKCAKEGIAGSFVYITGEGDKYHNSIGCSGLKRSVRQVARSQVQGRTACIRCYGR